MPQDPSIEAFFQWLKICEAQGYDLPMDRRSLKIRADHSALLERLLEGKEPLQEPPPRAFGYPWYDLVETGEGDAMEVFEAEGGLVINQEPWIILQRVEADCEWIVTYEYKSRMSGEVQVKRSNGRWCVTPGKVRDHVRRWIVKRID